MKHTENEHLVITKFISHFECTNIILADCIVPVRQQLDAGKGEGSGCGTQSWTKHLEN